MAKSMEDVLSKNDVSMRDRSISDHDEGDPGELDAEPIKTEKVETKQVEVEKPQQVETKPAQETKSETSDEDQEHIPDDLEGLKKALKAARGDGRKYRKNWHEVERKLAELEGFKRAASQFVPQKENTPSAPVEPDLNDTNFFDPNAIKEYVQYNRKSVLTDAEKKISEVEARWFQRFKLAARERHQDFDEIEAEFIEAAKTNPMLAKQADESPDPAEFAYKTGKALRELQGVNSIDDLKAKIRAELEAELKSNNNSQVDNQTPAKLPLPKQSIANARGTGVGTQQWTGARSLSDILA